MKKGRAIKMSAEEFKRALDNIWKVMNGEHTEVERQYGISYKITVTHGRDATGNRSGAR